MQVIYLMSLNLSKSDHINSLRIYFFKSLIFLVLSAVIFSLFWGIFALLREKEVIFFITSSCLGVLAYALPLTVYLLIGLMIPSSFMSAKLVLLRLIYAVLVKYLLIIVTLGLIIKFIPIEISVVFISFFLSIILHQLASLRLSVCK